MPIALNALELDIPEITATIFTIDPQTEDDAYSQPYYYESQIEDELSAKANRWGWESFRRECFDPSEASFRLSK